MNFFNFGLMISIALWSLIFDRRLLYIYLSTIILFHLINELFKKKHKNSLRRKIQICTWNAAGDPTIYSRLEIDISKTDEFLKAYNSKNPEKKLSYTIIGVKSLAEGLKLGFNKKIVFGNIKKHKEVDLSVLVNVENKNLVSLTVRNCKKEGMESIKSQMKGKITKLKQKKDKATNEQMKILKKVPSTIIQLLLRLTGLIAYSFGVDFNPLKIKKNHAGSGMVTNVVSLGVFDAYAPLINFFQTNVLMVICAPRDVVRSVDGQCVVRRVLNVNLTFDERFCNGSDVFEVCKRIEEVWYSPEKFV